MTTLILHVPKLETQRGHTACTKLQVDERVSGVGRQALWLLSLWAPSAVPTVPHHPLGVFII